MVPYASYGEETRSGTGEGWCLGVVSLLDLPSCKIKASVNLEGLEGPHQTKHGLSVHTCSSISDMELSLGRCWQVYASRS